MKRITFVLCTSLLLCSCGTPQRGAARGETGRASLHNVAFTSDQVAQCAAVLSGLLRGVPVGVLYEKVPELKRHSQYAIYPLAHGHDPGTNVPFGQDIAAREAFERAARGEELRSEWDTTAKEHPFLSSVAFTPTLSVGKYALNPTHALYLVTEHAARGDDLFAAAFVREERTD